MSYEEASYTLNIHLAQSIKAKRPLAQRAWFRRVRNSCLLVVQMKFLSFHLLPSYEINQKEG